MSESYQERKDVVELIKILVAILLTVAVAVGIAIMTNKSFQERAEPPAPEVAPDP